MRQVRERPLEEHDLLTQDIVRRIGGDMDRRAAGEDCTERLREEVEAINLTPLNEGPGEGYHRSTTHEHGRAPASTSNHLTQHNRHKQEMQRVRRFIDTWGERGKDVVRYEWTHYKRVLQTSWRSRWVNVNDPHDKAIQRIYHRDETSHEDWSGICKRLPDARPVEAEETSNTSRLEDEYLDATLPKGSVYAVPEVAAGAGGEGAIVPFHGHGEGVPIFEVVNVRGAHSRPHLMHTHRSADEPAMWANFAVEIQMMEVCAESVAKGANRGDLDGLVVATRGDLFWASARDLASFDAFAHGLFGWQSVEAIPESPGTLSLVRPERARPMMPITDESCPTYCVERYIRTMGWAPIRGSVDHTEVVPTNKVYDGRIAPRMKKVLRYGGLSVQVYALDFTYSVTTTSIILQMFIARFACGTRGE